MFAIANIPYSDQRLPFENLDEFNAEKAQGVFAVNMDRVPILVYNGAEIGQSKTIERFVAKKLGFLGANEIESALVDMICEHVRDIRQKYNDVKVGKSGEELNEAKHKFLYNDFPAWMSKLEKCLGNNGFAVGEKMSLADIAIQQLIQDYFDDKEAGPTAILSCPKITSSVNAVAAAGKTWFETRPVTRF